MQIGTREHYDILHQFEKCYKHCRLDREDKSFWPKGHIYQNGETNELYKAYVSGYSFGKTTERNS